VPIAIGAPAPTNDALALTDGTCPGFLPACTREGASGIRDAIGMIIGGVRCFAARANGVRRFMGDHTRKSDQIWGFCHAQQVCDTRAAGRPGRKSATMGGRAGNRRRMSRSGASRRPPAALPLYARLPAASPRHRPAAMKRIFARSRCRERSLPAALCIGLDFGAWLGLAPKQISTGDRTILGAISRRGNRYLRALFVQAAWVVLIRMKDWDRYGLKAWIASRRATAVL
jgi:hypothetical protein